MIVALAAAKSVLGGLSIRNHFIDFWPSQVVAVAAAACQCRFGVCPVADPGLRPSNGGPRVVVHDTGLRCLCLRHLNALPSGCQVANDKLHLGDVTVAATHG